MRLLLIMLSFTALFIGCSDFPTEFANVQTNEYRVLDFMYEPAEAAPGDTVHLKAVFGGKKIGIGDIDWKISHNVVSNMYGAIDTAYDLKPLTVPVETHFSDGTTCMELSFVIPSDIMYTSGGIPDDWASVIPETYQSSIPAEYRSLTKKVMLDTIGALISIPPAFMDMFVGLQPDLKVMVPLLCQFLTVKSRIFAQIKGDYLIKSDYSVRYNSKLSSAASLNIKVNRNPRVDSIGIYKVPGTVDDYNPLENRHSFYRLDVPVSQERTILLEKDYSYFVEVFTNAPDSTRTLTDIFEGTSQVENYWVKWFYQMDSSEISSTDSKDFMDISGDSLRVPLTLPINKNIRHFSIWAQVYDDLKNEVSRPVGSTLLEGRGMFEYAPGYLD